MNINDYKKDLMIEEQAVLEKTIFNMNNVIDKLDSEIKKYVIEASKAIKSSNPDEYLNVVQSQRGIKDKKVKREDVSKSRSDLYNARLLLEVRLDKGEKKQKELKIGLHQCHAGGETFIYDWKMPVCRHYMLDNPRVNYEDEVKGKTATYKNEYKLLVREDVTIKLGRVVNVVNKYPAVCDIKTLKELKGKSFFSNKFINKLIDNFDEEKYVEQKAEGIIADEFLQELLERRSTPEFRNIVFTIQRKQGEIIQLPYNKNIIVQGCAGSGKSMIMMHRLPIVLYDNPKDLLKTSVYIISPSPMYIQMAKNMRDELEISDIEMGTIENYYDECISRYTGHSPSEYGKISYHKNLDFEKERYIYSKQCIEDIKKYYRDNINKDAKFINKIYELLKIKKGESKDENIYSNIVRAKIIEIENLLTHNREVLKKYYSCFYESISTLSALSTYFNTRKDKIEKTISQIISQAEQEIEEKKELEESEEVVDEIELVQKRIDELKTILSDIETDDSFIQIESYSKKIKNELAKYSKYKKEFIQNSISDVYDAISKIGEVIGFSYAINWEISRVEDDYAEFSESIENRMEILLDSIYNLQECRDEFLSIKYYDKLDKIKNSYIEFDGEACKKAYMTIMDEISKETENNIGYKCSPYVYLQSLYSYYGKPSVNGNLLISIDEAQSIAKEEYRLIKNVNGNDVILNLYGDERQKIENSKGIDSWDELKDIVKFDKHIINQNYRNASQITNYCNERFDLEMQAINTLGKDVEELETDNQLFDVLEKRFSQKKSKGLKAVLVKNSNEAYKIKDMLHKYNDSINDMTGESVNVHMNKWNIILIEDAKGLEFKTVVAVTGNMTENEKYIAYTRALDELIVYDNVMGKNSDDSALSEEKKILAMEDEKANSEVEIEELIIPEEEELPPSKVREFFIARGFEVVDNRKDGGNLWVLGEKKDLRNTVLLATMRFRITGKYSQFSEVDGRNGWYTQTDK